jgi:DICT domain-containing protein
MLESLIKAMTVELTAASRCTEELIRATSESTNELIAASKRMEEAIRAASERTNEAIRAASDSTNTIIQQAMNHGDTFHEASLTAIFDRLNGRTGIRTTYHSMQLAMYWGQYMHETW